MPNQPKTPKRDIRVSDELWKAAEVACWELGTDRSTVVREALEAVVRKAKREREKALTTADVERFAGAGDRD